jgi:hypothetical protein
MVISGWSPRSVRMKTVPLTLPSGSAGSIARVKRCRVPSASAAGATGVRSKPGWSAGIPGSDGAGGADDLEFAAADGAGFDAPEKEAGGFRAQDLQRRALELQDQGRILRVVALDGDGFLLEAGAAAQIELGVDEGFAAGRNHVLGRLDGRAAAGSMDVLDFQRKRAGVADRIVVFDEAGVGLLAEIEDRLGADDLGRQGGFRRSGRLLGRERKGQQSA